MVAALKIAIGILLAFTALGLLYAVAIGRRRPPPADPFFHPFGEMPTLPTDLDSGAGFASPPAAGSGASFVPSDEAAARDFHHRNWGLPRQPARTAKPEGRRRGT